MKRYIINYLKSHRMFIGIYIFFLTVLVCIYIWECFSERDREKENLKTLFHTSLTNTMKEHCERLCREVGPIRTMANSNDKSHVLRIQSEEGIDEQLVDTVKKIRNIANSFYESTMHSFSLDLFPLELDSLLFDLNGSLRDHHLQADVALVYKRKNEMEVISGDSSLLIPCDSIVSYYVGAASEHEFTTYASIPYSFVMGTLYSWLILFCVLLFIPILYMVWKLKAITKLQLEQNNEVAVEFSMEELSSKKICFENYVYDVLNRKVYDIKNHLFLAELTDIEGRMFEALLNADKHCVSTTELKKIVWGLEFVTNEAFRSVIFRLRKKFDKTCIDIKYKGRYYELLLEEGDVG